MKLHFFASLLAALAVATLVTTPAAAAVKGAMKANSGYCKSGKLVGDTFCGNPLSRSLLRVKRTSTVALHMSAFDPKRTCLATP